MADVLDPAAYIYQGTWTDWSKGSSTWGLTLTLCPDNAVLVTSSLAVFVTLAGSQLWTIFRYTLHQTGARPQPEPATPNHTKQQLILRNAGTDLATARLMGYLAWRTRRSVPKKYSPRTIAIALFALVHAILFMIAGTFSNLAISTGSPSNGAVVLSRSKYCGVWNESYLGIASHGNNPENNETMRLSMEYITKRMHNVQLSIEYAKKCYLNEDSHEFMSSSCNTLKRSKLDYQTHHNGSCPFAQGICHQNADVLVFDTGPINSHTDLGINAKPSDRLTYQRITTCAIINDTAYISGWDGAPDDPDEPITQKTARANFGPSLYKNTDWTYSHSNFATLFDNFTVQVTVPYQVDAERVYAISDPVWSDSDFEPISEVAQDSADLNLFFLSYSGTYMTEIEDPWFSAHREQSFPSSPPLMQKRYGRDAAISTLGCTEQHQYCTSNGTCTGFGGFDQVQNVETFTGALNAHQNATFDRLLRAATMGTMKEVVENVGVTSTPLLAIDSVAVGGTVTSRYLPTDQWKLELDYWHAIAMAQLQRTIAEWSTGQVAPRSEYLLAPELEQDKWFCENFLIPSTVYQSFSIMSMILIVLFGTLIITVSLNVEAIARLLRRCFKKKVAPKEWDHDDMLRLPSGLRESFWRPKPPPKDAGRRSTTKAHNLSPDVPSIKITPAPSPSQTFGGSTKAGTRSSSPTLPPEDRGVSTSDFGKETPNSASTLRVVPVSRVNTNSWIAISLNGDDATSQPRTSFESDSRDDKANHAHMYREPQSPMLHRFWNPTQFHVPRAPGGWI